MIKKLLEEFGLLNLILIDFEVVNILKKFKDAIPFNIILSQYFKKEEYENLLIEREFDCIL
jgi:hypothetical protein